MLNNRPYNAVIYTHVIVNYSISKSPDPEPIHLWIFVFKLLWKPVCRFPNDFKIPDYRINGLIVIHKILKRKSGSITPNLFYGFGNICEQ